MSEVPFKFLWKVKIPQKIKIFLWLIARSKILSKGNLIKRMWKGGGECCFCGLFESTDHLFFNCSVARYIWRIVQIVLNLRTVPKKHEDTFGNWLLGSDKRIRNLLIVGLGSVLWWIWKTRNDGCFNNKRIIDPSDVVFLSCHWLDSWAILQKRKERRMLEEGSQLIKGMAKEVFDRSKGWAPISRRILR